MVEAAIKWQQGPDSCLFSSKTLLCLTGGILYFIILDFNAIFLVKSANSCRKGLVCCLDNHPQPHFRCKDFTAVWVPHPSQFKPNFHFSALLGRCTMPRNKKEWDVCCTLLLGPSNIHVASIDTWKLWQVFRTFPHRKELTQLIVSAASERRSLLVQCREKGRAVTALFTLWRQKHWPSATFWQLAVIKLQLARASCASFESLVQK